MTAPIALAACGGLKMPSACRADQMYIGSYSRACWRAAVALCPGRAFFISAGLGLVVPWRVIEPYEQRIDRAGAVSAARIKEQAYELGVLDAPVIVLAGRGYAELAATVWDDVTRPLAGLFIGQQLRECNRLAARGSLA